MTSDSDPGQRIFLVDRGESGTLQVSGPERLQWLQRVLTCDVADLAPGRCAYGLVLTKTGKILSDLWVLAAEDTILLATAAGRAEATCGHLDRLLVMEDAEIADVSSEYAWLAVHGPAGETVMRSVAPDSAGVLGALPVGAGAPGFVAATRHDRLDATVEQLLHLGAPAAQLASAAEGEGIRISLGLPRFGVDYDESHTPHQAGLEKIAVCWSKGCYVGQEVVVKQGMRGKTRSRLYVLELEGDAPPAPGTPVHAGDDQTVVGEITGAALAPNSNRPMAFARLKTAAVGSDRPLSVLGAPAALALGLGRE